jgi:hypothetical protein
LVLFIALVVAPVLMVTATVVENRFGPAVAGWVAAAPITISVASLVVGIEYGRHAASALTESSAEHVTAQVAFAIAFAFVVRRHGGLAAMVSGTAVYVTVSLAIVWIPAPVAIVASLLALVLGPRLLLGNRTPGPAGSHNAATTFTRAAVGTAAVGLTLLIARLAGPATAGATAAYPIVSATLALLILRSRDNNAAALALSGLCRGLPGYFSFCFTMALATPFVGVVLAVPLSFTVCLATYRITWQTVRPSPAPLPVADTV